jgi:hypothetical protein
MLFSRSGRDDADNFFAIAFLPVNMDYQQHSRCTGFDLSPAQSVPPQLAGLVIEPIRDDKAIFILEDQRGNLERNAAVNR